MTDFKDFELSACVYCHDLINPPTHDRSCDINLEVTNGGLIQFTKQKLTNAGTEYLLKIPHAKSIGLTGSEHVVSHEFDNLILAFNLALERVCMMRRGGAEFSNPSIPKKTSHSVDVTRKNNKVFVNIVEENLAIHEQLLTRLGLRKKM